MAVLDITMENFETTLDAHEMVILDFWAGWCKPCQTFAPVFETMAEHNPDIFFGKVNAEAATDLAQAFQVRSIPTLMAFKRGELVFEQAGLLLPAQLEQLLDGLRRAEPEASAEVPPEGWEQDPDV